MEQGSFTYKETHYYGSKKKIYQISWKGKGEVDSSEIYQWCINNLGNSGYQEEIGESRWLDNCKDDEIFLCKDEDLTFFLLKWA